MEHKQDWLDDWNPAKNPPRWYHCKTCNGQGVFPYGKPCTCYNGYKYAFVEMVMAFIVRQEMNFQEFKRWLRAFPLRRCSVCKKWYWSDTDLCPDENCAGNCPF